MNAVIEAALAARRDDLARLCRAHGVTSLEIFGSAAAGRFDPARSDYDFIVRFGPDPARSLGARYVAFSEALETLLGRPVDVITDHPIDNPYLRASVAATRRPLYVEPAPQAPA